jgi:hypothetical protein
VAPRAALQVFRVFGVAALSGYGAAHIQESIGTAFRHLFDSMIYALLKRDTVRLALAEILCLHVVFALGTRKEAYLRRKLSVATSDL